MLDYTSDAVLEKKLAVNPCLISNIPHFDGYIFLNFFFLFLNSKSLNNLIVLSRDDAGCNEIIAKNGLTHLCTLLTKDKDKDNEELVLSVTRIFSGLVKNSFKRAKLVYNTVPPELLASLISHQKESIATAASIIIQNLILSLTDLEEKRKTVKKQVSVVYDFPLEVREYIDEIFRAIIMLIMDPKCSGYGRDNCIDTCLKFVDTANGCGWTSRFIVFGVPKLLRVASTVPELKIPNSLQITEATKMHVSCCLSAVYDDIYSDQEREKFQDVVNTFVA